MSANPPPRLVHSTHKTAAKHRQVLLSAYVFHCSGYFRHVEVARIKLAVVVVTFCMHSEFSSELMFLLHEKGL